MPSRYFMSSSSCLTKLGDPADRLPIRRPGTADMDILTQIAPDSLSPVDALDPADLLEIDRLFSPDELALRARVRAFVDERIRPNVEGWFAAGRFPVELSRAFGELGVLGMHLEGDECPGGSTV